jgi:hypothetical protein
LIINRFHHTGIRLDTVGGNTIQGNYLGTDPAGTQARGNGSRGIDIIQSNNNLIGGAAQGQGNLISGNEHLGVFIASSMGTRVEGNRIGTDVAGTHPLGNGGRGIQIQDSSSGTTVGGTAPGAGNIIAFNAADGVGITSGSSHAVLGNSIFANGDLAIDLGVGVNLGTTLNDAGDIDSGPNDLQNFPVLESVVIKKGKTVIKGTLHSTANSTFRLEFFSSVTGDPSGFGEGKKFLGVKTVSTGAGGNISFTFRVPFVIKAGRVITVTATRLVGDIPTNTSEFSPGQAVLHPTN